MSLNNLPDISVPGIDSAENLTSRDVIGNKDDTHAGTSIRAVAHTTHEHFHHPQKVYPTLADGITLTTHANDWVLGTITEIVPASAIGNDFDIHEVLVEDVSTQNKTYEIVLYAGAGDTEIGRTRFSSATNKGGVPNGTIQTDIVAADSRIRAQLAIQDGSSRTAIISLRYHLY